MQRIVALMLVVLLTLPAFAQDTSALHNAALDKIQPLDLNTNLPVAMRMIGEQTGVRVEAASSVWELLPWGDQTTITAKIEGKTLRDGLEAIARKLGLVVVLREEVVELRPMPALARLGRRSNVQELAALDLLASTPANLGTDRPTVRQLLEVVDQKLVDLKSPFNIENRAADVAQADTHLNVPRNATLMEALEALPRETRATWYPWDKSIVILAKDVQLRQQLDKTVTLRYNGVEVSQVLAELSQRSGVEFAIEPGAIGHIPPDLRNIRLTLANATIRQALEQIAGFTGLGYVVNENGVYIWNQMTSPTGGVRDSVVGMVQLDNGMQIMVRESDVPPDVAEYLRSRKQRWVDGVREMMREEGFKPSGPATRPANQDL